MSQSALTQALRKLEACLGVVLFERSGLGVTETTAGELFVRRSRRAIELLSDVEREIHTRQSNVPAYRPLYRQVTASQLRALTAVVETGGYSLAARKLGLAQPTIHRAAKDLEAAVGVELFSRAARGVKPNDAARLLSRCGELVFAELRQGLEEVRELHGMSNSRVAVGCLPLARSEFLPRTITELLSEYPDARVSILDGPYVEQLDALRHGRIDWLIGALRVPSPGPDVVQRVLFRQSLAVVVRPDHPLLAAKNLDINALSRLEWVAPRARVPTRKFFDDFFAHKSVETPKRIIECSSLVATRGLLRRSDRAALLSPLQVHEDVESGQLALLLPSIPGSARPIGITTRRNWEGTMLQARFEAKMYSLASQVSAE